MRPVSRSHAIFLTLFLTLLGAALASAANDD
jgi:hypothetical protein